MEFVEAGKWAALAGSSCGAQPQRTPEPGPWVNQLRRLEDAERVRQALMLVNEAMELRDEPERLVWRLADAVGLLAEVYPQAIGAKQPTGRGYRVVRGR